MLINPFSLNPFVPKSVQQLPHRQHLVSRLIGGGIGSGLVMVMAATPVLGLVLGVERSPYPSLNQHLPDRPLSEPSLLAQRVVDRLPPPPPIPDLPPAEQIPITNGPTGSGPAVQDDTLGELFMVYVNGDSPLLLEQVQRVEPTASIQPFQDQNIILVGMFDRSSAANQEVERLEQRGIQADVASVSSVVLTPNAAPNPANLAVLPPADTAIAPPPASSVSLPDTAPITAPSVQTIPIPAAPRSTTPSTPILPEPLPPTAPLVQVPESADGAYYIVIPGRSQTLVELQEQVTLLGALPTAVMQRDRPLGPHLLVGPFIDQSAASRWNGFFRDFGLDARVYYKR